MKLVGIALLVLGVLALIYGGFWYTKEETKAEIGPLRVKVQDDRSVNVPVWAGVAITAAGAVVIATRGKFAA